MRGKEPLAQVGVDVAGITPAYAGKSQQRHHRRGPSRDHPRVCGEKHEILSGLGDDAGSPPRMRGKADHRRRQKVQPGITPAYAGKSALGARPSLRRRGSPPRMRGKALPRPALAPLGGITPAYAGKSSVRVPLPLALRDHPRVCGEKRFASPGGLRRSGSPPRMRGKVNNDITAAGLLGITPAYAGKSADRRLRAAGQQDHPRVCGEKHGDGAVAVHDAGSPPRMRGKVEAELAVVKAVGITPAYAGKRWPAPRGRWPCRDHPRVCGEKTKKIP